MNDKQNNEELTKFIMEYLEGMNKIFMQWFELLSIQLGGNSAPRSSNSSPHDDRKTHGEAIFLKIVPHNWPHEPKNKNGPEIPNFLESIEFLNGTYDMREARND